MRFKKWKMRVLYNETHLGLLKLFAIQIYMSVKIVASFRQTMFWGKLFWEGLIVESHAPS